MGNKFQSNMILSKPQMDVAFAQSTLPTLNSEQLQTL